MIGSPSLRTKRERAKGRAPALLGRGARGKSADGGRGKMVRLAATVCDLRNGCESQSMRLQHHGNPKSVMSTCEGQ
jgi:hypothetical protein